MCIDLFLPLHLASCHHFEDEEQTEQTIPQVQKRNERSEYFKRVFRLIFALNCYIVGRKWIEVRTDLSEVNTTFFCESFRLGAGRCNQGNTTNHLNVTLSACYKGCPPLHPVMSLFVSLISFIYTGEGKGGTASTAESNTKENKKKWRVKDRGKNQDITEKRTQINDERKIKRRDRKQQKKEREQMANGK